MRHWDLRRRFRDIGTQFQELIVQYEYPFKKNMALDLGYYFNHFGENDFAWDNLKSWMGSASPYSTFVGATSWTPYTGNAGYIALEVSLLECLSERFLMKSRFPDR